MHATTTAASLLTSFAVFANAAVHTVDVGDGGLVFKPQTINPAVGDTVVFKLYPQHNVVSGSFSTPCQSSGGGGGNASFFSGPFSETSNGAKKFVVNVTSTQPVYYYCAVQKHCQNGMVGGWNVPSSGNDIKAYASAASSVSAASAPSALAGGRLLDDSQLASVTASANGSSPATGSPTASSGAGASPTSGSPSSSAGGPAKTPNAAGMLTGSGAAAMGLGIAAMLL